jgi:adenylosuccinate lyase
VSRISNYKLEGKFNGAVGGYQALSLAYPQLDWLSFSQELVESFGFKFLPISTQINPQDDLVSLFQIIQHLNLILIGLNQDFWRYISDDWLVQLGKKDRVGSSTMPQKVNPIEFENSEGNLKMANGYAVGVY